jgi:hypothetical protein
MYILLYDVFLKDDNELFEQDIFHESLNEVIWVTNCGHASVSEYCLVLGHAHVSEQDLINIIS